MELNERDIQGIILRGYGDLAAAEYVLLRIQDGRETDAKRWLGELINEVATGEKDPDRKSAVHVAFTLSGLRRLGLPTGITRFLCEFEEGMTPEFKQRTLGDHGGSAPTTWDWGGTGPGAQQIDILLMLFAAADEDDDDHLLNPLLEQHRQRLENAGLTVVKSLPTRTLINRKEHFGFVDGVAQPTLGGTRRAATTSMKENVIAAGEFILGYKNEYDKYPESPTVPPEMDPTGLLDETPDGLRDLGANGSYLVFRQLEQDVKGFWNFLDDKSKKNGQSDPKERDLIAAKMVGRWRSGLALTQSPNRDDPQLPARDNFGYADDPYGMKCPIGSHIRRTNPRDSVFPGGDEPLTTPNVHRILRRGRAYGEPLAASMEPDDFLAAPDDGTTRGLHFMCYNTDIGRQFEFVQHTWVNNPKFGSQYRELDPIAGDQDGEHHRENKGVFSIPGDPVRRRITDIPRFVHVRGGAYFFLPGIRALKIIAALP